MHVTFAMVMWSAVITIWLTSIIVLISMIVSAPMDTDIWPGGEPR